MRACRHFWPMRSPHHLLLYFHALSNRRTPTRSSGLFCVSPKSAHSPSLRTQRRHYTSTRPTKHSTMIGHSKCSQQPPRPGPSSIAHSHRFTHIPHFSAEGVSQVPFNLDRVGDLSLSLRLRLRSFACSGVRWQHNLLEMDYSPLDKYAPLQKIAQKLLELTKRAPAPAILDQNSSGSSAVISELDRKSTIISCTEPTSSSFSSGSAGAETVAGCCC